MNLEPMTQENPLSWPMNLTSAVLSVDDDWVPESPPADIEASVEYVLAFLTSRGADVLKDKYKHNLPLSAIAKKHETTPSSIHNSEIYALQFIRNDYKLLMILKYGVANTIQREKDLAFSRGRLDVCDFANTKIEELTLKPGTVACLRLGGVETVQTLIDMPWESLMSIDRFRVSMAYDVSAALGRLGIFKDSFPALERYKKGVKDVYVRDEFDDPSAYRWPKNLIADCMLPSDSFPWDEQQNPYPLDLELSVDRILDTLTPDEKNILWALYRDRYTEEIVADAYGVSLNRMKKIVKNALRKIRHPSCWNRLQAGYLASVQKTYYSCGYSDGYNAATKQDEQKNPSNHTMLISSTIEDLELSIRTYNALKRAHFNTVEDIISKTEMALREYAGLGPKALEEIIQKLDTLGLTLAVPSSSLEELGLSSWCFNSLVRNNILSLEQLASMSKEQLINIQGIGRVAVDDIIQKLASRGLFLAPGQEGD